jgi:hypothetical protein
MRYSDHVSGLHVPHSALCCLVCSHSSNKRPDSQNQSMDPVRYVKYRSHRSNRWDPYFEHNFGHFLRTIQWFALNSIVSIIASELGVIFGCERCERFERLFTYHDSLDSGLWIFSCLVINYDTNLSKAGFNLIKPST